MWIDFILRGRMGVGGLISVVDCVRLEEENLLKYVTESTEWMLQKVREFDYRF